MFGESLSNTEVYLCNHGEVENYDERTTQGRFRWVPVYSTQ